MKWDMVEIYPFKTRMRIWYLNTVIPREFGQNKRWRAIQMYKRRHWQNYLEDGERPYGSKT